MALYLFISVSAALAMFIIMVKVGLRKVLGYDVYVDIGCTFALIIMFNGTVTGMISATLAGVILSIFLFISKLIIGFEKYIEVNGEYTWVYHPPKWRRK